MRIRPWYVLTLLAFVGAAMGSIYFTSTVETVQVLDKRIEEGRSRFGASLDTYIIQTQYQRLRIMKLPIIGYPFNAQDVFNFIPAGSQIKIRIGHWPPKFISQNPKPYILNVYWVITD